MTEKETEEFYALKETIRKLEEQNDAWRDSNMEARDLISRLQNELAEVKGKSEEDPYLVQTVGSFTLTRQIVANRNWAVVPKEILDRFGQGAMFCESVEYCSFKTDDTEYILNEGERCLWDFGGDNLTWLIRKRIKELKISFEGEKRNEKN